MKKFKNGSKVAFTLSEVLITLAILGIVAALMIPNIVQNYKRIVTETKFKTIYSQLTRIVDMINVEYGSVSKILDTIGTSGSTPARGNYFSDNYLKQYLNFKKECAATTSTKTCRIFKNEQLKMKDNTDGDQMKYYHEYELANGMYLGAMSVYNGMRLIVDINGNKNPNKVGTDIFYFNVYNTENDYAKNNSLGCGLNQNYSVEQLKTTFTWVPASFCSGKGETCSCLIIHNNLKIPKNYPW